MIDDIKPAPFVQYSHEDVCAPNLSICIATYNRSSFIGETLDSITAQLEPGVELVIVDGASPDNTPEVVAQHTAQHPGIRYYREDENSGIDRDYDKAVGYARGEYCWLMTDDDLLRQGAVQRVLSVIREKKDLIIVNAEIKNAVLSRTIHERRLNYVVDREFGEADLDQFFADAASYISFIGCVVVRRATWLSRDRASYYGTLFVHVGVIFQDPPINSIKVIADPLIVIRYGNAMWTPRSFEIWMFKWPKLVWSFPSFSEVAKQKTSPREPWRNPGVLFYYRATGAYSAAEFSKFLSSQATKFSSIGAYIISVCPATLANVIAIFYLGLRSRVRGMGMYDLLNSRHASAASRFLARTFGA